ncbi:peptidoglycan editing factor PgeF [Gallaecimonas kandeliae]|uniref:peptidoglycan editing factor PgeF n=1 Tax=Gallaecimonas kandeliae TaxID=3029055 RepID=UPI0026489133|nr:peptidoglycan editing factor PgeF [Gallaecimonas kandeliae]WKE64945.1 peptidoglycan editing factor PgeF [Gallaecimonas kandeliae]
MAVNAIEGVFPAGVAAFYTDRLGGVSQGPYQGFNLGLHVGDVPSRVHYNRALLSLDIGIGQEPAWLNQIHGDQVQLLPGPVLDGADAAVTRIPGQPLAIMTADCLPALFASKDGAVVGAAHAGWRGLAGGVLEATVAAMGVPATELIAWLGPCIGPNAFEVGPEVREAFLSQVESDGAAFQPKAGGKYLADLQQLAANRLKRLGVTAIYKDPACTFAEAERFFSYRRDGQTGRMAFMILRNT